MSVRREVAVVWGVGLRSVSVWKRQFPSPGTSTVWCGSSPVMRKSFWVLWFSEKLLHCSMGDRIRISEKLMKLLAVATVFQQERIDSFLVVK